MSGMSNDGYFEVFWPRTPHQIKTKPLAPRLPTLEGRTIAQLWDFVFHGDRIFELLEEGLRERYPNVRFVSWREFGAPRRTMGGNTRRCSNKSTPTAAAAPRGRTSDGASRGND